MGQPDFPCQLRKSRRGDGGVNTGGHARSGLSRRATSSDPFGATFSAERRRVVSRRHGHPLRSAERVARAR